MANELNKISALDLSNVATCRIENTPLLTKNYKILKAYLLALNEKTRVRLIGIDTKIDNKDELNSFFNLLDTFRGIDQNNTNVEQAQVEGDIEIINAISEHTLDIIRMRYPYIRLTCAAYRIRTIFRNWNGSEDLYYDLLASGDDAIYIGEEPTRPNTGDNYYQFVGWSSSIGTSEPDAIMTNITTTKVFYPAFADAYYITYMNYDGTEILGRSKTMVGEISDDSEIVGLTDRDGYAFQGWSSQKNQEDIEDDVLIGTNEPRIVYAVYKPVITITFRDDYDTETLYTTHIVKGTNAIYEGKNPGTDRYTQGQYALIGWNTEQQNDIPLDNMIGKILENVNSNNEVIVYPSFLELTTESVNSYIKQDEMGEAEDLDRFINRLNQIIKAKIIIPKQYDYWALSVHTNNNSNSYYLGKCDNQNLSSYSRISNNYEEDELVQITLNYNYYYKPKKRIFTINYQTTSGVGSRVQDDAYSNYKSDLIKYRPPYNKYQSIKWHTDGSSTSYEYVKAAVVDENNDAIQFNYSTFNNHRVGLLSVYEIIDYKA